MVQEPIRKNAANFMTLMPMFARRLAQRDYDFILVPPVKKRLLLKMYIIGMLSFNKIAKLKSFFQFVMKVGIGL